MIQTQSLQFLLISDLYVFVYGTGACTCAHRRTNLSLCACGVTYMTVTIGWSTVCDLTSLKMYREVQRSFNFNVMYLLAKLKPFEQKEHFSLKEQNWLGGI